MKIKPLQDRVVVERIPVEETTVGGIVLPDTAKEKPQRGRVLSIGPGRLLDSGAVVPISVKLGDEVLFGKYSGAEIEFESAEYTILREDDILARFSLTGESITSLPLPGAPSTLPSHLPGAPSTPAPPHRVAGHESSEDHHLPGDPSTPAPPPKRSSWTSG